MEVTKRHWARRAVTGVAVTAIVALTAAACSGAPADESAPEKVTLVWAGFGGASEAAQRAAWFEPFEAENPDIDIVYTNVPDWGQYTAAVEAGDVRWDVLALDAQSNDLEKYFEPLDCDLIACDEILPYSNVTDWSSIYSTYGAALCYNRAGLGGAEPTSWADFFDTEKFPGPRAIQNTSGNRINLLIGAMLSAGTEPDAVTPFDFDVAFAELDKVKPTMIVTDGQAATTQAVLSGEAVMGTCQDSQVAAVDFDLETMGMMWDGHITGGAAVQIAKGSRNVEAAQKLVAYILSAENNAKLSFEMVAGPSNENSLADANPANDGWYSAAMTDVLKIDYPWPYVRENGQEIQDAFTAWITG